jgi:N-acetylglucosaminyl-diphospho-decaprenol L-rhamnosyltransferase
MKNTDLFANHNSCNLAVVSIYVSHKSEAYIKKFSDRHGDELGKKVFIINSSSNAINAEDFHDFEVVNVGKNIGFSAANNTGIKLGAKYEPDYFLLVNPDVFLPASWLQNLLEVIDDLQMNNVGIFTVPLLGYDFEKDKPTGLIDSLAIDHTWYGRWFDVSQGDAVTVLNKDLPPYEVIAACGALMLIEKSVIHELLEKDGFVFNESYFMYKEDIELSLRVRKLGKSIMMIPSAPVFHCRGWEKHRGDSPYWARKQSALNELNMHLKYYWRFLPYSFVKYFYVRFFEIFKLKWFK